MFADLICSTITGFDWNELKDQISNDFTNGLGAGSTKTTDSVSAAEDTKAVDESASADPSSFFKQFLGNLDGTEGIQGSDFGAMLTGNGGLIGILSKPEVQEQIKSLISNSSFGDKIDSDTLSSIFNGLGSGGSGGASSFSGILDGLGSGSGGSSSLSDLLSSGSFFS